MARYLLLVLGVILLNFFIPRLLPGDPLLAGSGQGLESAVPLSGAARDQLRSYYRLDEPLGNQLISYLGDLARGDLGWSISRPAPVGELILSRLPWTLALLLFALLLAAAIGTAIGVAAGWRPGRLRDRLAVVVMGLLAAIPEFLLAIGLLLVFAVGLGWFPLFGGQSTFTPYGDGLTGAARRAIDIAKHLTLPALALTIAGTAGFALLARDATIGVRTAPWLVAARAKGLSEPRLAWRHALPNLALPLLTFFGLRVGGVLGGALVIERVFSVPGLGLLGFQAIQARDYPLLQGLFLLSSVGVLAANLVVDLISLRFEARHGGHRG